MPITSVCSRAAHTLCTIAAFALAGCAESAMDLDSVREDALPGSGQGGSMFPGTDAASGDAGPALDAGGYSPGAFDGGAPVTPEDAGWLPKGSLGDAAASGAPDGGRTLADAAPQPDATALADAATSPLSATTCKAGLYKGTFSSQLSFAIGPPLPGLPPSPYAPKVSASITGTIAMTIAADGTLSDGTLSGADPSGNAVKASLAGSLDCVSHKLRTGTLTRGSYTRPLAAYAFTGTLAADYAASPASVSGTFTAVSGTTSAGTGTWSAALAQ